MNHLKLQFYGLYRWHATTSQADEHWATTLMGGIFKDKPIDDVRIYLSLTT